MPTARVVLSAGQAGALYRALRRLDHDQREAARAGSPVDRQQECRTQCALTLIEPLAAGGGEISAELGQVLVSLGLARLDRPRMAQAGGLRSGRPASAPPAEGQPPT